MKDTDIKANSGNLKITTYPAEISVIVKEAQDAVDTIQNLPPGSKKPLKDFIEENIEDLIAKAPDLIDFPVPESIAEWWPAVVEVISEILQKL